MAREHRVPVVVEAILEKVTNIAMGTDIDRIKEFEEIDCRRSEGIKGLVDAGRADRPRRTSTAFGDTRMTSQPLEIGFIGLGITGAPLAAHLLAAGQPDHRRAEHRGGGQTAA